MPARAFGKARGTTNSIILLSTDFKPTVWPPIVIVTPLSDIGSQKLCSRLPIAVRGVTAGDNGAAKLIRASIPGDIPVTEAGVTGVGVGDGDPVGVGVGVGVGVAVGVAVGLGVGVGLPVGVTGKPEAPVTNVSAGSITGVPVTDGT